LGIVADVPEGGIGKAIGIVRALASAHVVAFDDPAVGVRAGDGRTNTTSSSATSRVKLVSRGALNGFEGGGRDEVGDRGITGGRVGLMSDSVGDPASRPPAL
jgi:hypothetical protein